MSIKPYYTVSETKRKLRIQNLCNHNIAIGQTASSWNTVNFVIMDDQENDESVRWLATLEPTNTLELTFNESQKTER